MKKSKPNNNAGKGDKPRNCYSEEFKKNFRRIDWSKKKIVLVDQNKVYLYPDHLNELIRCLLGEEELTMEEYLVTDESMVGDFLMNSDAEELKRIKKFEEKYDLKPMKHDDFIWKIVEKTQGLRPF